MKIVDKVYMNKPVLICKEISTIQEKRGALY